MADSRVVVVRRALIPEGGTVLSVDSDLAIAVFRVGDSFYAIDNRCPHKGGPLGRGTLSGFGVTCPWPAFTVDVRTGVCPRNPVLKVRAFAVEEAGDELRIAIDSR